MAALGGAKCFELERFYPTARGRPTRFPDVPTTLRTASCTAMARLGELPAPRVKHSSNSRGKTRAPNEQRRRADAVAPQAVTHSLLSVSDECGPGVRVSLGVRVQHSSNPSRSRML